MPEPPAPVPDYSTDVIADYLPNGISLLSGASGVGKTTLLATWSTRFRDGKSIFGHQPRAVPFLGIMALDRAWASHVRWFTLAGWPDVPHYSFQDDLTVQHDRFYDRKQLPLLFRYGLQTLCPPNGPPPGSVVFVDPISLFLGSNLNDYTSTALSLYPLNQLCCQRQICCVGTTHQGKQKMDAKEGYKRPEDRILGSTGQLAFSNTQMCLEENGEEETYLFGWRPHHGLKEAFELVRNSTGLFVPLPTDKNQHALQQASLLDSITCDGTYTHDLLEMAHVRWRMSKATVYRYLDVLKRQGFIATGPERGMVKKLLPA